MSHIAVFDGVLTGRVVMQKLAWLLVLCSFVSGCGSKPPSDAQLIATFDAKQTQFEQLRIHLCARGEKRIVMMDPEWSKPTVSTTEKQTLYGLFRELNVSGVYYDGNCSFRLPAWSVGFAGGGNYMEYVYRPDDRYKNAQVITNLDSVNRDSSKVSFYLRPISGDWYLVFEHWP
jgi:hypothetical protein